MKRLIGGLAALLVITGTSCSPIEKEGVAKTSNATAKVEVLFDVDGYRVYRFHDGRTVYFVLPSKGERAVAQAMWWDDCGKNCVVYKDVVTAVR